MPPALASRSMRMSLACLCIAVVIPFLMAHHLNPIATFFQEWVAAAFGVLAAFILWQRRLNQDIEVPRIALIPLGLIAILLVQYAVGLPQSLSRALLVALYLLWSVLLMVTASNLRRIVPLEKIATVIAFALVAGSLISALFLALQLTQTGLDSGLVFPSPKGSGNLGQRNHLGNYLWLGIASTVFLRLERRLAPAPFILILSALIMAASLTGSRSVLIYAAGMLVLSLWATWRFEGKHLRRTAIITAAILLFTLFAQWLLVYSGLSAALNTEVSGARMIGEIHGTSQRIQIWRTGLAIFADHPWLGAGIGQFSYYSYLTVGSQTNGNYFGGGEHAHNVFIQLASEFGFGALLLLLIFGLQWWRNFIQSPWSHTQWWIASLLLVIGAHSQLEYPLWYAFFLGIASIALGLGANDTLRPQISQSGVWLVRLILVLAVATLLSLGIDYRRLENTLNSRTIDESGHSLSVGEKIKVLSRLHRESLLSDYVPLAYAYLLDVNREVLGDKISVCETAIRFSPVDTVTFKLAWLLALDGRNDDARLALQRAVATHPSYVPTAGKELAKLSAEFPTLEWLAAEMQKMAPARGK